MKRERKKCQIESMIMQNVEHDFFLFHSSIWKLNVKLNKFTTHPLRTEKTEQKKICLKTKLFSMWINKKSLERNHKWYSKALVCMCSLECERNGIGIDSAYLGTSQKFNVRCSVLGVSRRSRWDKGDKFSEIIICSNIQSVNWAVTATTYAEIVRILMKMNWFRCVIKYILVDSATKQPTCQCNLGVKRSSLSLFHSLASHWISNDKNRRQIHQNGWAKNPQKISFGKWDSYFNLRFT